MRVYYISLYCLLRPSTNRIFDVRFCEGLAQNGIKVELIYPYLYMPYNIRKQDVNEHYGIRAQIKLKQMRMPAHEKLPNSLFAAIALIYNFALSLRLSISHRKAEDSAVIVSRHLNSLLPALLLRKARLLDFDVKIVHLLSEVKSSKRYKWLYRHADGFIGLNSAILDDLAKWCDKSKVLNMGSPVPESHFDHLWDRETARAKLNLNVNGQQLVVYTGKLYKGQKEVAHILEAAAKLPRVHFLFTGGKPEVIRMYEEQCRGEGIYNVTFTGFIDDSTRIRYYQMAADVLVSYYTTQDHFVQYNFPQKITEYMAACRPIVTPDYLATRDVLNESNAIFVKPGNSASLVAGIRKAVEDRSYAESIALQAYRDVQELTFKKRARLLIDFLKAV
jgi:glycosyltransferase involved in cell wall biosynthesis